MRKQWLNQIGLDSGSIGAIGTVVHRFGEPGRYLATVFGDGEERAEFRLVVADGANGTSADGGDRVRDEIEVHGLDLAELGHRRPGEGMPTATIDAGSHVAFSVGSGDLRWAVVVRGHGKRTAEFDSRRLKAGDRFAAMVLRPGAYRVSNQHGEGGFDLRVRYVRRGRSPYRPGKPITIAVDGELPREPITVGPGQGLIFEVGDKTTARIVIDLVEQDDGPDPQRGGNRPVRAGGRGRGRP